MLVLNQSFVYPTIYELFYKEVETPIFCSSAVFLFFLGPSQGRSISTFWMMLGETQSHQVYSNSLIYGRTPTHRDCVFPCMYIFKNNDYTSHQMPSWWVRKGSCSPWPNFSVLSFFEKTSQLLLA